MILLIDNHDSFTYNIVEMIRRATVMDVTVISSSHLQLEDVANYKYIILSPGASLPNDYPILYKVIDMYIGKLPILGICLGFQALCHYFGGELVNYNIPYHGVESIISCDSSSLLFNGRNSMAVGRYHSWYVKNISKKLNIVAATNNGEIMAVENREMMVFGTQFHPESYITEYGETIFTNFFRCND